MRTILSQDMILKSLPRELEEFEYDVLVLHDPEDPKMQGFLLVSIRHNHSIYL